MDRKGMVALTDLAKDPRWPSRPVLFNLVRDHRIPRYKFPGDRKTYIRVAALERVLKTPSRRP